MKMSVTDGRMLVGIAGPLWKGWSGVLDYSVGMNRYERINSIFNSVDASSAASLGEIDVFSLTAGRLPRGEFYGRSSVLPTNLDSYGLSAKISGEVSILGLKGQATFLLEKRGDRLGNFSSEFRGVVVSSVGRQRQDVYSYNSEIEFPFNFLNRYGVFQAALRNERYEMIGRSFEGGVSQKKFSSWDPTVGLSYALGGG